MTTRLRWTAAAAGLALLAGCTTGSRPPAREPQVTVNPFSDDPASSAPVFSGAPDFNAPETVATGLDVPWGLAFLPDGSALVAERDSARILRVRPGDGAPREVYRVPGVVAEGEGGLLGLAVAADFSSTGLVYAYFTAAADNRIIRFSLRKDRTPQLVFSGIDKARIHNGGRIAFGPDGMLYVGTGDAGTGSASQDPADTNGKILRLTADGKPAPGNPTEGSPVWSLGHRNVHGEAPGPDGSLVPGREFGQLRDDLRVLRDLATVGYDAHATELTLDGLGNRVRGLSAVRLHDLVDDEIDT
jgi:glucose/arabinose dehydrogenase